MQKTNSDFLQPAGLADSSRWSFRVKGERPPGSRFRIGTAGRTPEGCQRIMLELRLPFGTCFWMNPNWKNRSLPSHALRAHGRGEGVAIVYRLSALAHALQAHQRAPSRARGQCQAAPRDPILSILSILSYCLMNAPGAVSVHISAPIFLPCLGGGPPPALGLSPPASSLQPPACTASARARGSASMRQFQSQHDCRESRYRLHSGWLSSRPCTSCNWAGPIERP